MYNVLDANGKPDGLASIGCPLSVNRHEWSEECKLDKVMIDHSLQLTFDLVTKGGSLYNLFSNTREHGLGCKGTKQCTLK